MDIFSQDNDETAKRSLVNYCFKYIEVLFSSLPKQAEYRMELLAFCHVFISYLPAYSKIFNRYESFSCQKQNIKFKAFAGGHQLPLITARVFLENHTYHGN